MQRFVSVRLFFFISIPILFSSAISGHAQVKTEKTKRSVSGVYPHLAFYNQEGECGTGALVPWAGRLWAITYGPHMPNGSSDKLYEITDDLILIERKESVGGTPANRLIHSESQQLFIGPYAIDENGNVRVISYNNAPGRYTGAARHLNDPANKIYIATMEEGFYEVDVKTLKVKEIYPDGNKNPKHDAVADVNPPNGLLPGAHGKGLYSGQGVLVYSNNGEATPEALKQFDVPSGVLAEWNGVDWTIVRRNQFVEVTGPGGIYGNQNTEKDPIWATGWDHKSVIVGVRGEGKWHFYRLPKASHSYDGAHGWNTEWPRIRNIGTASQPDYLMTMHGMFWKFPATFSVGNTAGIRPRSSYLKVIGDFTRWGDRLVFGCDDAAEKEFLNKRGIKGNVGGPGQSNSNLWFTDFNLPDQLGPKTASGAVWLNEEVQENIPSEPILFNGWPIRTAWILNGGKQSTTFTFEVDRNGNGHWEKMAEFRMDAGTSRHVDLSGETGEWIRVVTDLPTKATVQFSFADLDNRNNSAAPIFQGLASTESKRITSALLYGLGDDSRSLGLSVRESDSTGSKMIGYYELDADLRLVKKRNPTMQRFIEKNYAIPSDVITIDDASVLVVDDRGRRWRLPISNRQLINYTRNGHLRLAREAATERDLLNCMGTFFELPAENADGFAKIRPIASHPFCVYDFTSFRGMLILAGIDLNKAQNKEHVIVSDDRKAAVWAGVIDDLWNLGKPVGEGGPWKNADVKANEVSDPYLMGFYDKRSVTLSHNSKDPVTFTIEVEPLGHGPWMKYVEIVVPPFGQVTHVFPQDVQARWVRFRTDRPAIVTAHLLYE